ncbi:All-trans-phytoene synthase [Planctomycetes bacterium CA13]|uniref:All-trans-phytoene synthase n=1 Tax=Novipirellula herctigrandis TaxID=2527986 RepID=A0A5C5Z6R4_9BACT|nr:All-trans-phytoene synthase [Planctomycetes bacterium CA13]
MPTADEIHQSEALCRRMATSHYENFLFASVLLPRRLRQSSYNVYAFCRTADDLADESSSRKTALASLAVFQQSLDRTFAGAPPQGLFPALFTTIRDFDLPKRPFDDLLDAFRQDQNKTCYANFEELLHYCERSANPVGRIMLDLAEANSEANIALSNKICTALQLVNFWQDVARDYAIGRIYLPTDQMDRFGVKESHLSESKTSPELRRLLQSECQRAERFFDEGEPLIDAVPSWFGRNLRLIVGGGRATIAAIRQIEFDVLSHRPTLSKWTQTRLLVRSLLVSR